MIRSTFLIALVLAFAVPAAPSEDKKTDEGKKSKKPALELRIVPRFSFSPVNILFTAELNGGDDSETFHCPEVEWEWDDGGKSVTESDCDPYEPGAKMDRRFTAEHYYKTAGSYLVKVTLRKASKTLAAQTIKVLVRPGLGDRNDAY